ncbi:MAG: SHOCT domain-containing protein [Oscillospiraceae bacterium]|nr:SHOCT domain-containing protein [Oscillospiraceae bacterium]
MMILGFAAFAVTAAALILMIRQLVSKGEASNRRSVPILSVFSLVMLIVFSAAATFINQDFTGAEYRYGMNWMFYLLAAVYLAAALVSVIGYRQAKRLGIQAETADMEQAAQRSGSADELLKYKRLLDEGTISEEEFTEIKKRLL